MVFKGLKSTFKRLKKREKTWLNSGFWTKNMI